MSNFDRLLPFILSHEGVGVTNPTGLVDIPGDPGGLTNWGISQKAYSRILMKAGYGDFPQSVRDLTREQAEAIYKNEYYLTVFDELPPAAALVTFDCEVNQGLGIKILQRAIGVLDDGKWGPVSETALRVALRDVPKLVEELLWQRLAEYDRDAKPSMTFQSFLAKFWVPRLIRCRQEAKTL